MVCIVKCVQAFSLDIEIVKNMYKVNYEKELRISECVQYESRIQEISIYPILI